MKALRKLSILILTVFYSMTVTAEAAHYVPSPTLQRPVVIDPDGLTDILVVTPYRFRQEMLQQYKIDNFEAADNVLTQDTIYEALTPHMSDDMQKEYLTVEAHYYVHEKEDRGIVQLPVTVTVATDLDFGDGYVDDAIGLTLPSGEDSGVHLELLRTLDNLHLIRTAENSVFLHLIQYNGDGTWTRIPATFRSDGTFTFTVDHYGAYALIGYRVHEHGDRPGHTGHRSPQTGEKDPYALVPPVLAVGLLSLVVLRKIRESQR